MKYMQLSENYLICSYWQLKNVFLIVYSIVEILSFNNARAIPYLIPALGRQTQEDLYDLEAAWFTT